MSSYTTAIVSPHLPGSFTKLVLLCFYFPNQKQRNYRWVEKTFGLLSARTIEFAPRIFCFSRITIKMRRRWEIQISNSLTRQNNNFARASRFFAYISLPSLHDYHVKMPSFTFCEGRKQAVKKFSFSLWTWKWLREIQFQRSSLAFDKVSELE